MLERSEVVFAVRIVVRCEAVERRHALGNFNRGDEIKVANAAGNKLSAKAQASSPDRRCRVALRKRSLSSAILVVLVSFMTFPSLVCIA